MASMKTERPRTVFVSPMTVSHAVNDMAANVLPGMLPILSAMYGLSYALAGFAAALWYMTSSILQPILGRWFDRTQANWLIEVGVVVNCAAMGLIGLAFNYNVVIVLVAASSLGSAAFHPPALLGIVRSGGRARGRNVGIFLSSGNVGFFLGPLVAGFLIAWFGLYGTLLLLPLGLVTAMFVRSSRKGREEVRLPLAAHAQPVKRMLLYSLVAVASLRSVATHVVVAFLPLYFVEKGASLILATGVASFWLAAGALGQVGGGFISDRVGRRVVMSSSLLAGAAALYGFVMTSGPLSLMFLGISGALLSASWSVIVVMSSEAAPDNVGAATGLLLGLSIGIGGVGVLGFGGVADVLGLTSALELVTAFALAAGIVALFLPGERAGRHGLSPF